MLIIYGRNHRGKIKALGGQSIKTAFLHLFWIPLIPTGSMYVIGEDEEGNTLGYPVKFSWLSMLLAYLRTLLFFSSFGFWSVVLGEGVTSCLPVAIGITLLWLGSFYPGRSNPGEKYERLLLGMGTGLFAPPDWLPGDAVKEVYGDLIRSWTELEERGRVKAWKLQLQTGVVPDDIVCLLFSLARYSCFIDPAPDNEEQLRKARQIAEDAIPQEQLFTMDLEALEKNSDSREGVER